MGIFKDYPLERSTFVSVAKMDYLQRQSSQVLETEKGKRKKERKKKGSKSIPISAESIKFQKWKKKKKKI